MLNAMELNGIECNGMQWNAMECNGMQWNSDCLYIYIYVCVCLCQVYVKCIVYVTCMCYTSPLLAFQLAHRRIFGAALTIRVGWIASGTDGLMENHHWNIISHHHLYITMENYNF